MSHMRVEVDHFSAVAQDELERAGVSIDALRTQRGWTISVRDDDLGEVIATLAKFGHTVYRADSVPPAR